MPSDLELPPGSPELGGSGTPGQGGTPGYGAPAPAAPPPGPAAPPPGHGRPPAGYGGAPAGYGYGPPQPQAQPQPQPRYGPVPQVRYGPVPMSPGDERTWATLAHVGGLIVPFAWLIIYFVYRDRSAFVRRHAAEATNFHLSVGIYQVATVILGLLLAVITAGIGLVVLFPVLIGFALLTLVAVIMGALAANRGAEFRYPLTIRMVH